ncbi:uncharacterized protein LOC133331866 [Musca vetustissima]|uniref:uncharacterized protein LOC133331866 n=1 Tax=Musca vetustissima TaxID=27455 RepID=UPI002AB785B9|nr:uncharacterized protein LOC133331866 [Musca vetustissima]
MKVCICILVSLAVVSAGGYGVDSTSVKFGTSHGGVSHVSRKFGNPGGSGGYGWGAWAGSPIPADYEYTIHHGVNKPSYGGYGAGAGGWAGNSVGGAGYDSGANAAWAGQGRSSGWWQ